MSESKIQIVNSNDEIVGNKDRDKIDFEKEIYRVAALWVTNSNGGVLLAQRKWTKDKDPGKWGPAVAGTLEEGETYESNIYKEAEEEIRLTNLKVEMGLKVRVDQPHNHFFCQWYTVTVDKNIDEFKMQEEEIEQLAWVPKGKLIEDIRDHPENYVLSMPQVVKLFCK